jgi:hypothetical protein
MSVLGFLQTPVGEALAASRSDAMRPGKREWAGSEGMLRGRPAHIINLRHELTRLADRIDRTWIDAELGQGGGCGSV